MKDNGTSKQTARDRAERWAYQPVRIIKDNDPAHKGGKRGGVTTRRPKDSGD